MLRQNDSALGGAFGLLTDDLRTIVCA